MSQDPITLLVAAPADAEFMAPGSSFDYRCSRCGKPVMLAPTGQRMLRNTSNIAILCAPCFHCWAEANPEAHEQAAKILAGSPEDIRREVETAIPNTRLANN